jgi:hypothetical protein
VLLVGEAGEVRMPRIDENGELKRFIYGNLTSMIIADGQLVWMRYNAMLTANSIVAAVLGVGIHTYALNSGGIACNMSPNKELGS